MALLLWFRPIAKSSHSARSALGVSKGPVCWKCIWKHMRYTRINIIFTEWHTKFYSCVTQKTPSKIPICKICNKEFKSRTILYRHRQTHMEKLIQCGSCHKMFSTVSQIQSHQAKLKHDKIFKCAPCGITFTSVNDLKVFIQIIQINFKILLFLQFALIFN